MTAEGYIGSNAAAVLDTLTTAVSAQLGVPLEMKLGLLEDTRTGAPPRVTWVDKDPGGQHYEDAPFALPGTDLQWLECRDYDVHAWARSDAELSAIVSAIRAQLDISFGPVGGSAPIDADTPARPGYAWGGKSSKGPRTDPSRAGSAYVVFPVTLKAFVSRRPFGTAVAIQSTPLEVDLADSSGSDPAIVNND
jgi:hypothetical protein